MEKVKSQKRLKSYLTPYLDIIMLYDEDVLEGSNQYVDDPGDPFPPGSDDRNS